MGDVVSGTGMSVRPVEVREFHRSDRDQLTALVNRHVAAVLPGLVLSTNVVLGQLEREPVELVVDPWVVERRCLVAIERDVVVAATLVRRFGDGDRVRSGYRGAAELRWLVADPDAEEAGAALVAAAVALARRWSPTRVGIDPNLPAPGCVGLPDVWPHIRRLVVDAGFTGPARTERVLVADCRDLVATVPADGEIVRSVGTLGTRLTLVRDGVALGYVEVDEPNLTLARSSSAVTWTDVGNLIPAQPGLLSTVMGPLLAAAAEWLLLGGVDRLLDYYAPDVHEPEYLSTLGRLGFVSLVTNGRGWELPGAMTAGTTIGR